jgi:transposase-like protein
MTKHREHPIALKQAAVARVAAGESVAEVAHDLKLRGRLLYAWRDQVRRGGPPALRERGRPRKGAVAAPAAGAGKLARAQRRVAELERKIGQQQVDLDFFRRALRACEGDTVSQRRAVYEVIQTMTSFRAARPSHDRAPVSVGARQPRRLLPPVNLSSFFLSHPWGAVHLAMAVLRHKTANNSHKIPLFSERRTINGQGFPGRMRCRWLINHCHKQQKQPEPLRGREALAGG